MGGKRWRRRWNGKRRHLSPQCGPAPHGINRPVDDEYSDARGSAADREHAGAIEEERVNCQTAVQV